MKKTVIFILTIILLSGCQKIGNPLSGFEPGLHTRTGLFDYWGTGPTEYDFNKVPSFYGFIKELPHKELIQDWLDNAACEVEVKYRIFQTVDHAEIYTTEWMDRSSLRFFNFIEYPIPGGQIGDNCFHQVTAGFVMFIRNNVWILVGPPSLTTPYNPDEIERVARSIDSLIVAAPKSYWPDQVPAPKIKSIKMLPPYPKDWGQKVMIKVVATDSKSDTVRMRVVGYGYSIISLDGTEWVYPDSNYLIYRTSDPNKFRFMAWVWNEDNVVALADKEFAFDK